MNFFPWMQSIIDRKEKEKYEIELSKLATKFKDFNLSKAEKHIFKSKLMNIVKVIELLRNMGISFDRDIRIMINPLENSTYISMEEFFISDKIRLNPVEEVTKLLREYNRCRMHLDKIESDPKLMNISNPGNVAFNYRQCIIYMNIIKMEILNELVAY